MENRASILIGLLWCVMLLAVIVVGVLHTARMDLLTGKNFGDKIQARYLALAGIERAEALLYQNAHDRSHSGKNHTGQFYDDPQDFRDVDFGRGSYSVLRRGRDDEGGGVIYGVADEESRLNVNVATADELTKIQGLGSDVATAITGWRTRGGLVSESDYYLSLKPPYKPRGAPFQTVRELLMVRGVTADLLYGRDRHQNGLLDDLAEDLHDPAKYQDTAAAADLGWADLFTVDSSVKNVNAAGQTRVNIQTADESSLANVPGITRRLARTIVSYRQQNRFQSIADLLNVKPTQNNGAGRRGRSRSSANDSSDSDSGPQVIDTTRLMQIGDDVTTVDGQTLPGAINVNTAGLDVLMCLPGLDRNLAQALISYRQSSGFFANPAELLKVEGLTTDIFKQIAPYITTRSETYRILAEGRVKSTGVRQRIQMIVRINLDGVKTLSYREDDL
jgi:DNA uptake protein ComE-like DNA-binding protein